MSAVLPVREWELSWEPSRADNQSLRKWLGGLLFVVALFGIVIPWLTLPEPERAELEELPPQLAKILMEKPKPKVPPPPPPPKQEKVEPPKEQKPVEKVETVSKPEPKVANAREKAAVSGLLAFKDTFADMREAVDVSKLQDTGAIQRGAGQTATIDRSLLTSKKSTRSAGVNVAALSRDTGGVALAGRATTKVDAPEDAVGSGGVRKPRPVDARNRSIEEIRRVFDSNKGAIFAIYNRTLRVNPTLQGEVVLELVIAPSGAVADVRVIATEIADQTMIDKIVKRIRLFNFGERDVKQTTIRYPVHFLPT